MSFCAAFAGDNILEGALIKTALRAGDIDVLFFLEKIEHGIHHIQERQLQAIGELLGRQHTRKINMLKDQLGQKAHAQAGLFQ